MLKLPINEHIDFSQYVSEGDEIVGKNGVFDLDTEVAMDMIQYLPNKSI